MKKLFELVCQHKLETSVNNLAEQLNVSVRTVYSDIEKLNYLLNNSGYAPLTNDKGVISYRGDFIARYELIFRNTDYWIDFSEYRPSKMMEYLIGHNHFTLDDLVNFMKLSRTIVTKELEEIRTYFLKHQVKIAAIPFKGFFIDGDEINIRNAAIGGLSSNLLYFDDVIKKDFTFYQVADNFFSKLSEDLGIHLSDYSIERMILILWIVRERLSSGNFLAKEGIEVKTTKELTKFIEHKQGVEALLQQRLTAEELYYLSYKFNESTLIDSGELLSEDWVFLSINTEKLIQTIAEATHHSYLTEDKKLFENLLNHLRPAIKRAQTFEPVTNPMFDYIFNEFYSLHQAIKRGIVFIEREYHLHFSEEELSFITLLFATSIESHNKRIPIAPRVIIVCSAGLSTSNFIRIKLENLFKVNILGNFSRRGAEKWLETNEADLIISTIKFTYAGIETIVVNPYLLEGDLDLIEKKLRYLTNTPDVSHLIQLIERYATIQEIEPLKKEIEAYFGIKKSDERMKYRPMLLEVLDEKLITVHQTYPTREEAVKACGQLLVNEGLAKPPYIQGMLDNLAENGPYIVIAPHIAMPHARPETGALGIGLSIITLAEPIKFNHPTNDPVKLVIGLCATDHQSHLRALSELVEILAQPPLFNQILEANSAQEILGIFRKEQVKC